MLEQIINYSIRHKLIVLLFTMGIVGFGLYALSQISIGAVPDITNNQVQVITTSRNLSTQDVEQFITYPVELEMANLPGVKEIRSVSKFGLSVVTIVFEDRMGTYLPRQLIEEKIKAAEEKIPAGFGKPFMGPVTTGLGEIYQYILDVRPGYEGRYSIMELRTIQDWIVKRQLSGIPGVVEVNTWGGQLKQYEVAIDPQRLRSIELSVTEVYQALEQNNNIAGGGYIEKTNESYFVRGEGLINSLEDIEQIVVDNRNGTPIFVKDIAKVQFGAATRFGAITANGQGEKVLGQVMMLKDGNSKAVIESVQDRVAQIQKSLPEGVYINAFLDRSVLIGKTTSTVAENLILGCLIVIFVVVLLLGNFRSGLVVASVIPLCLLFALSLMYLFGVDANLMSLGAIDFGIIIDGAVIIVEYVAYKITTQADRLNSVDASEKQNMMDEITFKSTTKMMRSAVFGQIIIIIVFIPILSLTNVEGKMFSPMALTFCFALIGAMLLCFTYVPVMSALFLKPAKQGKRNISVMILSFLQRIYTPTMAFALRNKGAVLAVAALLLLGSGLLFSRMGGEFVPTLDEGDFVIQPVLKTGTSLSKTIETTTAIESILKEFPEVNQVVTRIGAAEVPTDPMSMEESDVIITLKPFHEWTTADTKDGLADAFKEALSVIPGIEYEFTQPIEMRFNELITGVRADLAIKVFGEDLDVLNDLAQDIKKAIDGVEGAADISVEKVAGLPQMSVRYQRDKIAKYGLNIADVNNLLTMNFAGLSAGSVFEGEKQFDLVVRYDAPFRKDLENLQNSFVPLPNGQQIPLRELAAISYTKGPAKISRDETKRRIVVGVNVRNRDLESVVQDVQGIIEKNIDLPVGYSITYGGQFENLRNARNRLMVAVPIALALIFIMLYFAFQSAKEALMVYSAIPLSAIGGILLLYLRGMPFSISAGVGFIALFGIAVLNGIVLIEHFKELKAQGMTNLHRRILVGTQQRLRPVLLTAAAAALGFLPMALSTSAGAEVQRPLATVVVGGLISATLLTLLVLPVLYAYFDRKGRGRKRKSKALLALLPLLALSLPGQTQTSVLSLEQVLEQALANNAGLESQRLTVSQQRSLLPAAYNIDRTHIYYGYDQNNIAANNQPLSIIGVEQTFQLPGVYRAKQELQQGKTVLQEQVLRLEERHLTKEVSKAYLTIVYWAKRRENFRYLDSLYRELANAASRRYELGETNYLEQLSTTSKQQEITLQLQQCDDALAESYQALNQWLQTRDLYQVDTKEFPVLSSQDTSLSNHPAIAYLQQEEINAEMAMRVAQKGLLPDLQLAYFAGTNGAPAATVYHGFQVGVGIPLWRKGTKAQITAAGLQRSIIAQQKLDYQIQLQTTSARLQAQATKHERALEYYRTNGQQLAQEIIHTSTRAFQTGEIDFLHYLQALDQAKRIENDYLDQRLQYYLTILELNYLLN
ncbi:CusA/CzcA family heavy metal efflux RND transporter [Lewinella cohaerens]|uniref:CusA/CzcA family heavy metal efflux RND transporter n=1 Tax=Lewinella cohaerens TaxID=70995 RepID=UPI0003740B69|nr:CusA/CzcA family heavy metal efflux RND transporter [Lewinella cohaerens]